MEPIGLFRCAATHRYDAARQPSIAGKASTGAVELFPGHGYEQALRDLPGFSHIWLLYLFHHNTHWKPVIRPPRANRKVGVFASRAPYRPNPIGLSCVALLGVEGRTLTVGAHDLLDGTPILDIKPYLAYTDSVPQATQGWLDELGEAPWTVLCAGDTETKLDWLAANGIDCMSAFLTQQLTERPFAMKRKRVRPLDDGSWEIAYRTWRARYTVDEAAHRLAIHTIYSGYAADELAAEEDPHADKALHRAFNAAWPPVSTDR